MRKTEMLVDGQELSCIKTGQSEGSYPGLRKQSSRGEVKTENKV